ncbi:MAG: flavodoxin family protein [Candidatus Schekmanbacteria bacterium]|nr:flavodoxin family protein [Candidatus Schekmanbacteria bacterium]
MILGLCGSGRKEDSNSGAIVQEVLKGTGGKTELVWLIDLNIGYCTGCMRCAFEGNCWQNDGMTELYKKIIDCEALVIGSPCYYGDVSGLVKSMMDRSIAMGYMGIGKESEMPMHGRKPLAGKPAVLVSAVAGHGVERALQTMEGYVTFSEMKLVGKIGAIVGMGDVREKPDVMAEAKNLGGKIKEALKK